MFKRLQANYQTQEEFKEETTWKLLGFSPPWSPCFCAHFPRDSVCTGKSHLTSHSTHCTAQTPQPWDEPGPKTELTSAKHYQPQTWAPECTTSAVMGSSPSENDPLPPYFSLPLPVPKARKSSWSQMSGILSWLFYWQYTAITSALSPQVFGVRAFRVHCCILRQMESPWMTFLLMQATEKKTMYDKCWSG